MKKWLIAAAVVAAGMSGARADGPPCNNCAAGGAPVSSGYVGGSSHVRHPLLTGDHRFWTHPAFGHPASLGTNKHLTRMPTLPVYMAAPWYLYWPYDGHFQTVAPMAAGAFYPPPQANYGNPYMPVSYQNYVPGNPNPQFPVGPVSR